MKENDVVTVVGVLGKGTVTAIRYGWVQVKHGDMVGWYDVSEVKAVRDEEPWADEYDGWGSHVGLEWPR